MKKQYIITVGSINQTLCDGCVFEFANKCPDDCSTDMIWSIIEAEEYKCNKEIKDV